MYVGNTVTTEHEEIHKGDRVHPKHGRATENKENYEGDKVHHKNGRSAENICLIGRTSNEFSKQIFDWKIF